MIGEFTQNALVTIITQTSSFLFGLGTSIIIARILGPEGKGIYSLAILLPSFLVYFSHLGIGHATVFYLGKRKYRKSNPSAITARRGAIGGLIITPNF